MESNLSFHSMSCFRFTYTEDEKPISKRKQAVQEEPSPGQKVNPL